MFQFAGLPLSRIPSRYAGSPIRISRYHRSCAPPPGFSQLSTSFFGSRRLGILRVPFPSFSSLNLSFLQLLLFYLLFISHCPPDPFKTLQRKYKTSIILLPRKEVIHPHLPVRIPCYDFTPITIHTLGTFLLTVEPVTSGANNSRGVTGGVYKTRERIHRGIADPRLLAIPTS